MSRIIARVHLKAGAPSVTDDIAHGFRYGDFIKNTSTDDLYTCDDAAVGAAVWTAVAGGGGSITAADVTSVLYTYSASDPTVSDDNLDGYVVGSLWVNTGTLDMFRCDDTSTGAAVWTAIGGGGGSENAENQYYPDARPGSAGAADDEFDGSSINGAWTQLHVGSDTLIVEKSHIDWQMALDSNSKMTALAKAIPGGDWTIATHVYLWPPYNNYSCAGLILRESSSDKFINWGIMQHSGLTLEYGRHATYQAWGTDTNYALLNSNVNEVFLRIRKISTTLYFDVSYDGKTWFNKFSESFTAYMTPNQFGIGTQSSSVGTTEATFEWFRQS